MIAGPFEISVVDKVLAPSVGSVNDGMGDPTARLMRRSGRLGRRMIDGRVDWRGRVRRRGVSEVRVKGVINAIAKEE